MTYPPDLLTSALKMLSALIIVLGGLFLVFYFSKRFIHARSGSVGDSLIRVLSSNYIGAKKTIALVEVPDEILVLGITNDRISLLSKIENPETITQIKNNQKKKPVVSFAEQLQFFSSKFKGLKNGS